jgi:hypothetical protein
MKLIQKVLTVVAKTIGGLLAGIGAATIIQVAVSRRNEKTAIRSANVMDTSDSYVNH